MKILKILILILICTACQKNGQGISRKNYDKGYRFEKNGWIYVHIEGNPYERGKQYGYLIAPEFQKALDAYKIMTYESTGMDYSFFVKLGVKLHKKLIPKEYLDEMQGMADGLTEANVSATLDDMIGWNSFQEITNNYWSSVQNQYKSSAPLGDFKTHCSAFIATGNATKDNKIIIGHDTFDDFWNSQFDTIIIDILPTNGNRILMQSQPLFLSSIEDFFLTSAGIVAVETTISSFNGYDETKMPEYIRARMAMQYATDIDSFVKIINDKNNGGLAANWLIGDINTNEIARYQEGLIYQQLDKKTDGYFAGFNANEDPRIRNLECSDQGYNDIRKHTGSRRVRWEALLQENYGKIDLEIAQKMLSDHYDVYLKKEKPSALTICAHYDEDPRLSMSSSSASHPDPYSPAGAIDCKITTTDLAKKMQMWARYGRACGKKFDAEKFLKAHPQWGWQKDTLKSRESQSWTLFSIEDQS